MNGDPRNSDYDPYPSDRSSDYGSTDDSEWSYKKLTNNSRDDNESGIYERQRDGNNKPRLSDPPKHSNSHLAKLKQSAGELSHMWNQGNGISDALTALMRA